MDPNMEDKQKNEILFKFKTQIMNYRYKISKKERKNSPARGYIRGILNICENEDHDLCDRFTIFITKLKYYLRFILNL